MTASGTTTDIATAPVLPLTQATMPLLPDGVDVPGYDRAALRPGHIEIEGPRRDELTPLVQQDGAGPRETIETWLSIRGPR